jgi:hypothetical protein
MLANVNINKYLVVKTVISIISYYSELDYQSNTSCNKHNIHKSFESGLKLSNKFIR